MLKLCESCHSLADISTFPQFKRNGLYKHRSICAKCYGVRKLLTDAQYRASKSGLEFCLAVEDIQVPERCPVLGMRLTFTDGCHASSPSLDRIDSRLGYIPNNVQVISTRANHLKRDATLAELQMLGQWAAEYQRKTSDDHRLLP